MTSISGGCQWHADDTDFARPGEILVGQVLDAEATHLGQEAGELKRKEMYATLQYTTLAAINEAENRGFRITLGGLLGFNRQVG